MGRKSTDADQKIAQRIRLLRLQREISQEHLAKSLNLSFQQVQKYERGTNRVSAGRLLDIAFALSVPVTAFYEGLSPSSLAGEHALPDVFKLSPESVQLALSYMKIDDPAKQRHILALVQSVAGE